MEETRRKVGDWAPRVRASTPADFAAAHPFPFLVQERSVSPDAPGADALAFATLAAAEEDLPSAGLLGAASLLSLVALRVCKRDGSGLVGMVNVGRAENCDVVLAAPSVSKFHAFFTRDPVSGTPQVVDGGSTNGTAVNGRRLEPHEPEELAPRDLIAFGADAVFRFHSAETFHELVGLGS